MAFLTVQQAARELNVSDQTIRNMIERGDLSARRSGRVIRIPTQSIEEFGNCDSENNSASGSFGGTTQTPDENAHNAQDLKLRRQTGQKRKPFEPKLIVS